MPASDKKTTAAPASVLDVATYILRHEGSMSTMKLQKLAYYGQAWSLVWDDAPLFGEDIEAWRDGPVVRRLFEAHKGRSYVNAGDIAGNPDALAPDQKVALDTVLASYGKYDGLALSRQTHGERPWLDARDGLPEGSYCEEVIPHESMRRFYGSL